MAIVQPMLFTARGLDRLKYPEKDFYCDNSQYAEFLKDSLSNLEKSIRGKRVTIVDEHVFSGQTVKWIFEQVTSYGGQVVLTPHWNADYYQKLWLSPDNIGKMTSPFADFMTLVGQKCFKQLNVIKPIIDYFGAEKISGWFMERYK